jgi:hypothetical protein
MTDTSPTEKPPLTTSEQPESPIPSAEDASGSDAEVEEPDPFDELWDPDMVTRPERIRRTRAKTRPDVRTRVGGPPRGKRRDVV